MRNGSAKNERVIPFFWVTQSLHHYQNFGVLLRINSAIFRLNVGFQQCSPFIHYSNNIFPDNYL